MRKFRVYYDDGSTDDSSTPLENVRGHGVIGIVQDDNEPYDAYKTGRELLYGSDWYWVDFEQGVWMRGDLFGMQQYLIAPGPKKVLAGVLTNRTNFHAVLTRMREDADFSLAQAKI